MDKTLQFDAVLKADTLIVRLVEQCTATELIDFVLALCDKNPAIIDELQKRQAAQNDPA